MAASPPTKLALVTGSTSGIGLGIARVCINCYTDYIDHSGLSCTISPYSCVAISVLQELAGKGFDVVLHGLGTPEVVQSAIQACQDAVSGQ